MNVLDVTGATLAEAAVEYARAGLAIFPLDTNKMPLQTVQPAAPSQLGATTDTELVAEWWARWPTSLIGHRVTAGQLLIDIDPRHHGDDTWRALVDAYGRPPATRAHYSGRNDGGGHIWLRAPLEPGERYRTTALDQWAREHDLGEAIAEGRRWTAGIDLLHHGHRYTILPPSPHPDTGQPYRWKGDGIDTEIADIPGWLRTYVIDREPERPSQPAANGTNGDGIIAWYKANHRIGDLLASAGWQLVGGNGDDNGSKWRHPNASTAVSATVTDGSLYVYSPNTVFEPTYPSDPHGYDVFDLYAELHHRGDRSAAARAAVELRDGPRVEVRVEDLLPADEAETGEPQKRSRLVHGGTWILDAPDTPPAIWGADDEVLWAEGEPLLICAPSGVGKTTIAAQVLHARLGLSDSVLDRPVRPTERPVLYLACDRPAQIRRALGRIFRPQDRAALDHRLIAWEGPPPEDFAKHPERLALMCAETGAGTVIIDSLKDVAVGLTDDEVGAGLNRAIQTVIADGVEVIGLHHQRKGVGGAKPNTLEDVYGSTWITAGAGSVILLWGKAGDPIVELIHLKQPASEVGPFKVEHDHHAGTSIVLRGIDLLRLLRNVGPNGLSVPEIARLATEKANPTEMEQAKQRRKLDTLVRKGLLRRQEPVVGGAGGTTAARYVAVDDGDLEDLLSDPQEAS